MHIKWISLIAGMARKKVLLPTFYRRVLLYSRKKKSLFSSEVVIASNLFFLKEGFCQLLKNRNIIFSNKTRHIYLKSQVGWYVFWFFGGGGRLFSFRVLEINLPWISRFFKKWNFPLRKFQRKYFHQLCSISSSTKMVQKWFSFTAAPLNPSKSWESKKTWPFWVFPEERNSKISL